MENNEVKILKCPNCGCDLKEIDIIYKQIVYERYNVDFKNKTLTHDWNHLMDSEVLHYECTECDATLPSEIVKILIEEFEQD